MFGYAIYDMKDIKQKYITQMTFTKYFNKFYFENYSIRSFLEQEYLI